MTNTKDRLERRLLLLAPTGKDSSLIAAVLSEAGIDCMPCANLQGVVRELESGAAALIVAEEAIANGRDRPLIAALAAQPPWSDLPVLVLTRAGADSATISRALEALGNVTLLERPTRVAAIVSTARSALRGRQRQYELREQLEALRRSERNLSDFFENAAVGLHWVDADGIVIRANQTELNLLGYAREEYVGRPIAEFHADADVIADILRRLRAGETLDNYEARLRARDGSIIHVLLSSNVLWEDGRFIHSRCFTRDITEHKRAEQALREADRRKDEFLATLAHELRNPLAPIRNSLHILRLAGSLEPSAEPVCEMMERQVNQLVRLVDDLMEISRITRGKIELRREQVELAAVIRSAVETSKPLIDSAGHRLSVSIPREPVILNGDPVRLAQVFANLLNNSAKYTDDGGQISIAARTERDHVIVAVRDTGMGIVPEMLPRVFEMFTQMDHGAPRAQGGLGIGLALVRALVEMHGGQVEAHSGGPGTGSEFIVRLPLAAVSQPGGAPPPESRPSPILSPRRVLVVDDNHDAADSLGLLLKFLGADVHVVYDGAAALEAVQAFQPAVVFLDIGMPQMDGYEVARRVHQISERDITLIALTGWGQEEDRRRTRAAGFDYHLIKPAELNALQSLLVSLHSSEGSCANTRENSGAR